MPFFPQSAPRRPCYVLLDGQNRPVALAGGVVPTGTIGRPPPPPPVCGLNIDSTSLGRGHIMGLELGGPDVTENIVPQYQEWQEYGAWRQMEVQAAQTNLPQPVFVVLMEYGNGGDAGASNLHAIFRDQDSMVYWDDYRIPTRFQIWLLSGVAQPGAGILTSILGLTLAESARAAAAGTLARQLSAVPTFSDFTVTQMPQEDVSYWRRDLAAKVVEQNLAEYHMNFDAAALSSPFRETEAEYILGRGDEVRSSLKNDFGWDLNLLNQYATNEGLLQAVYHQKPLQKGVARRIKLRQDAYVEAQMEFAQLKATKLPKGGGKKSQKKFNRPNRKKPYPGST